MSLKRKSPYGSTSASPAPGRSSSAVSTPGTVKDEEDVKRRRMGVSLDVPAPGIAGYNGQPGFRDPRTVVLELRSFLKDAYLHVEDRHPGTDVGKVLEMLKTIERVKYNETNRVFSYEPDVLLRNAAELRTFIRTNSQPLAGLPWRELKEAMPGPECAPLVEDLERRGDVLVLRSLVGRYKDAPLPALGRDNAYGEKLNGGGPERWKMLFWDDLKERGRAGRRVDDETIFGWADVKIAETDDIGKLLQDQDLEASSAQPPPPKVTAGAAAKKKKARRAPMRINNVHMKALGIDFSKDYEGPS